MERPLPDDVARPVRAYLAALVSAHEVSDAWHELVADVAYWGERQLLPALRLAHQVVLQHERVAPEVAALALADVGVDDPADVAVVLDTDVTAARGLVDAVRDTRSADEGPDGFTGPGRFAERPRAAVAQPSSRPSPPPSSPPSPSSSSPSPPTPPAATPAVAPEPAADAVRIGFDEDDGPLPDLEPATSGGLTRFAVILALVLVVALLVWVGVR